MVARPILLGLYFLVLVVTGGPHRTSSTGIAATLRSRTPAQAEEM